MDAIQNLPEQTVIRRGALAWPGRPQLVLGGNPFLVILVDLDAVEPVGAQVTS